MIFLKEMGERTRGLPKVGGFKDTQTKCLEGRINTQNYTLLCVLSSEVINEEGDSNVHTRKPEE